MRLFIAIFPPKEYTRYFADVYKKFDKQKRNLKPINMEQLHITLKFIGANVSEGSKDLILETLQSFEGQFSKPSISIKKIQFGFDRQTDPKHLLADIEASKDLVQLSDEVHGVVKALKKRDTIRWKDKHFNDFHITIARMKQTATKSTGRQIKNLVPLAQAIPIPEPFIPEYMELMESVIRETGPVYRKIGSIKL
jgi:2'-5' RNA ligase